MALECEVYWRVKKARMVNEVVSARTFDVEGARKKEEALRG